MLITLETYSAGKTAALVAGGVGAIIGGAKLYQMYKEKKEARREAGAMQCYKQVCRWVGTYHKQAVRDKEAVIRALEREVPNQKVKLEVKKKQLKELEDELKGFGGVLAGIQHTLKSSARDAHNERVRKEIFQAKVNGTQYQGDAYDDEKTPLEIQEEKIEICKGVISAIEERIDEIPDLINETKDEIAELNDIASEVKDYGNEEATLSNAKFVLGKASKLLKIWASDNKKNAKAASKELEQLLR